MLQYFPFENCSVKSLPDISKLKSEYNINEINCLLNQNDTLGTIYDCNDMLYRGWYIISGNDINKLKLENNKILSIFEKGLIYE